jgi:hypothetical protein
MNCEGSGSDRSLHEVFSWHFTTQTEENHRYRCYVHYGELILRELDYIVIISFGYILYCVCFNLYCGGFKLFFNVWVCMCVYGWVS